MVKKYAREPAEPTKAAKTQVKDLRAHYKNTYEVARSVKGLRLLKAIKYLQAVLEHKQIIPFRKYCNGVGRHAQAKVFKLTQGRWPLKPTTYVMQLLKNLQTNAETKGLDVERCVVSHVQVNRAVQSRRRTYRAHGRITPYLATNCHVEMFVTEKPKNVRKAEDKKGVRLTKRQAARQRLAIGA
eukprot:scpid106807/ scgid12274/ 60S ribosomal protein L17